MCTTEFSHDSEDSVFGKMKSADCVISCSMNNDFEMDGKVPARVNYPTRTPFKKYLEKLVAPKSSVEKPLLEKRAEVPYLVESWPTSNAFSIIKQERIKELKRQANDRRRVELARCRQEGKVEEKIPKEFRQRFTAHARLKDLVFEENLSEVHKHGILFGPPNLTFQPKNKHDVYLLSNLGLESPDIPKCSSPTAVSSEGQSGNSKPTLSSYSGDLSPRDSIFNEVLSKDDVRSRTSAAEYAPNRATDVSNQTFDKINTFINDRKKICMVELAIRTKEGEIERLNEILAAESQFLAREEKELLVRHDEHDRYLKSICQRTAEAIHLAENEAHKRLAIMERIKRTRYKLAHLNAECIKLEEEFLRLSTYKNFLDTVARTLQANRQSDSTKSIRTSATKPNHHKDSSKSKIDNSESQINEVVALNINQNDGNGTTAIDSTSSISQPIESTVTVCTNNTVPTETEGTVYKALQNEEESALNAYFKSPQDLVDTLAELESNNLTLIENVQEQEEACERVRVKAAKLQKVLNIERCTVDEHISREKDLIEDLKHGITEIDTAKEAISEFTLLDRYGKIFNLGAIDQFDEPWVREERRKNANPNDEEGDKPRVGELLEVLHDQIHKIYCKLFGGEGAARLDTLMMLKILETTIDDLARTLAGFSRAQILKAKRTVDEQNRFNARQRQKELEALAHEARLKRAIVKAREPPRWHRGRRLVERSCPPERERTFVVKDEQAETVDADADLFKL